MVLRAGRYLVNTILICTTINQYRYVCVLLIELSWLTVKFQGSGVFNYDNDNDSWPLMRWNGGNVE
jgi:hypothetical protein